MADNLQWRLVGHWLGVLAILISGGRLARAELTVQELGGPAVQGIGPYYQDMDDAIRAFSGRDFQTALARLQNAKKLTPALPPAEVMMARLYFDAGVARGGNAMLEAAIKSSPQDPEAYLLLAERAAVEGRMTEAELMLDKIENLVESFNQNPRRRQDLRVRAYTLGATVDQVRGNLSEAKQKLANLVRLDPKDATAHEKLGRLLFAQNDQRGAYEAFKLAAQANDKALPADLMMASLYADNATAKKWLDRAIQMNPEDLRTQVSTANYLLSTNQLEQAKLHAEKAIALDPDAFDSNAVVGQVATVEGNFDKAAKHLAAAHVLQPLDYGIMNQLAMVLGELPDEASQLRGLQFAELVARQNPENSDYLATLGWINYRLNRKAVAERILQAVLKSRQSEAGINLTSDIGYYLANVANDRGNTDEAIKLLQSSLSTDRLFTYRKAAEQLLAKLTNTAGDGAEADAASNPSGQPAR